MRTLFLILALGFAVQAGSLERKRAELDSLKLELEYSRRMVEHDSTYASKVFEDSIKVAVVQGQYANDIEDSMEPNRGWVWFTVCIGLTATVMSIVTIADNANATE